ncbi:hypothetical protein VTK73DRAFT_6339 [Phialemonium thermophilum]|uniref:Altered inheritance of mitochondria protein 24, mitochondrial n=1 Tax=Phialemonium thermophilum TaxID=223376 RepID=A0ABR3UZT9_9PEZI
MRGHPLSLAGSVRTIGFRATWCSAPPPPYVCRQCRSIQISPSPTTDSSRVPSDAFGPPAEASRDPADARFEVLGSPYSLLSVTLSPSQRLYTRRGTLVSVAGNVENVQSTLASPPSRPSPP